MMNWLSSAVLFLHQMAVGLQDNMREITGQAGSDERGQEAGGAAQALRQLVGESRQVVERPVQ